MSLELSALLVAWIVIILLAFALSGLMRQMRMLQDAIGFRRVTVGPAVGSFASSLNDTRLDGPTVLLFLDNDCEVCTRAADELAIQAEIAGEFDFVAVYRQKSNGHRVPHAKTIANASEAFGKYRIPLTPFAVAVSARGRIADAAAVGSEQAVREFIVRARRRESDESEA